MTVQLKQITQDAIESVTCDICGRVDDLMENEAESTSVAWKCHDASGDAARTCVCFCRETSYDRFDYDERIYHLCPDCFEKRLEPWIKEMAARAIERT
jgi:hypothetical protein